MFLCVCRETKERKKAKHRNQEVVYTIDRPGILNTNYIFNWNPQALPITDAHPLMDQ